MHPIIYILSKAEKIVKKLTSPSSQEVQDAFQAVVNELKKTNLDEKYWICGGVLLGYAREGKILDHDKDIDFHYWKSDSNELSKAFEVLMKKKHFKYLKNYKNNEGIVTQHVIKYKRIHIDFFMAEVVNEKIQWYCYTTPHWNRPARQLINQVPYSDLEKVKMCSVEISKPKDHELYLYSLYGNWRQPMHDYTYYIDSKAIISKTPWRP